MEAQAGSVFSGNVKFPVQHIREREKEKTRIQLRGGHGFHSRPAEKKKPSSAVQPLTWHNIFFWKIQSNDPL